MQNAKLNASVSAFKPKTTLTTKPGSKCDANLANHLQAAQVTDPFLYFKAGPCS